MKVILIKDVKGVGAVGEVKEVASGYGQNFLIKKGLAKLATAEGIHTAEAQKQAAAHRKQVEIQTAQENKRKLQGTKISFKLKAGASGKVFGSISSKEIESELKKLGYDVDKKNITTQPIKTFGTFDVSVKLYTGISATIQVVTEPDLITK
ncbi:MAG: 50S ribosomal protein L9 [Bacillota bacterium]